VCDVFTGKPLRNQRATDRRRAERSRECRARKAAQEKQRADAERAIAAGQRDRANALSNVFRSRELAAHAEAEIDEDPERAILLALEGLRREDTAEAGSTLIEAALHAWPYDVLAETQLEGAPNALALRLTVPSLSNCNERCESLNDRTAVDYSNDTAIPG